MGQFVSTLVKGIDSVASDIASAVSDAGTTAAQLTDIAKQFTPPVLHRFTVAQDAPPLTTSIKNAMTSCQTAVTDFFKTQFGTDVGSNADNGCVQSYQDNGDIKTVIGQMTKDFTNWGIDADPKAIGLMAATIQEEVVAKGGLKGVSFGTYNIDSNDSIDWVVGYATFQITPENKGLVYAFCAQVSGGWKKKG